jgi:hypothetical protein
LLGKERRASRITRIGHDEVFELREVEMVGGGVVAVGDYYGDSVECSA